MFEVMIDVQTISGTKVSHTGPLFETKAAALEWVGRVWRGTVHKVRIERVA